MAAADLEVVEIVRGGDLDRAGAFFRIGVVVADDRDGPADQRQDRPFADQRAIHRMIRMHRNGGVAQHGLRARGCHDDELAGFALDRITQIPQRAFNLAVLHFQVGDRGL